MENLEQYKEHMKTIDTWKAFTKEHPELNLPSYATLIRQCGSWKSLQRFYGLITGVPYKAIKNMREDQVLNLLEPYRMQLSSTRKVWDDFVEGQDNLLPTSTALITYFGSWNEVKKKNQLGTNDNHRPNKYTDQELFSIVKEHEAIIYSPRKWDAYRKAHNTSLPSSQTIAKRIPKDKLKELEQQFKAK